MKDEKIVIINGQRYDSTTGLPLKSQPTPNTNRANTIRNIQSSIQKVRDIQTRVATKSPATTKEAINRRIGRSMDIARSKSVSHFTSRPTTDKMTKPVSTPKPTVSNTKKTMDIGPAKSRALKRIEQTSQITKITPVQKAPPKTMKQIKEEAIAEALKKANQKQPKKKKKFFNVKHKAFYIVVASLVAILLISFAVYVSIPVLSIKVASASAGISATYPEYKPDGYRLDGFITFSDNQVKIKFRANTGNSYFEIKQVKSSWDSSALKDKVIKDSNNEFLVTEQNGLTIYTYDGNAAWVNHGILYTITGNAPLSNSQLQHIATSL